MNFDCKVEIAKRIFSWANELVRKKTKDLAHKLDFEINQKSINKDFGDPNGRYLFNMRGFCQILQNCI